MSGNNRSKSQTALGAMATALRGHAFCRGHASCPNMSTQSRGHGTQRRLTLWLDADSDFFGAYENPEAQARGAVVKPALD